MYDPEIHQCSPEEFIEFSRGRRTVIAQQIRRLRYEYDELLADEIHVKIGIIGGDFDHYADMQITKDAEAQVRRTE